MISRPSIENLPPVKGYSHAVVSPGPLVAISGQVPLTPDGTIVGENDPEAQARQVFHNLRTALQGAGSDLTRILKLTVFLTDLADLPAYRKARDEVLDPAALPASSLVQVTALVHPAFRIEIDALATI